MAFFTIEKREGEGDLETNPTKVLVISALCRIGCQTFVLLYLYYNSIVCFYPAWAVVQDKFSFSIRFAHLEDKSKIFQKFYSPQTLYFESYNIY